MTSEWRPHQGQQTKFLSSPAFEALFGGAAGPGKTECLVMEALRQIWHPKYTGIIFRRTFPMLEAARGIIQRSLEWYPAYGGKYNDQKHYWKFPTGARIYFGHMQYMRDMLTYQSAEFSFVGFDELTEFEEQQYLYMFTRCRRPAGSHATVQIGGKLYPPLRAYVRSASNPGNIGHRWVKKRFITRDIVNQLRYFATIENEDTEVDRNFIGEDGTPDALSRAFYPAKLSDNPSADPNYHQRIRASGDAVRVAQLIGGDWDAEHRDGLIYDTWSSSSWPDGNVTSEAEYRPDKPLYWACDDGYVFGDGPGSINYHPRVILMIQDNGIGGLDVIDEYVEAGENHAETLKKLLLPWDGSEPEQRTRWHQYKRPDIAYMPSEAQMFQGEVHKYGIMTVNSTHPVGEGIRTVRQLIVDGNGQRALRVHPRCQCYIYEKSEYRSDPKGRAVTGEIVPRKVDDHTNDAERYLVHERYHLIGA
jgi:hypothetical protein